MWWSIHNLNAWGKHQRGNFATPAEFPPLPLPAQPEEPLSRRGGLKRPMTTDKPFRRLPLRDLLTDAEKRARDLGENMANNWILRLNDLKELSRPIRKRSHYPTMLALLNSFQKAEQIHQETEKLFDYLRQELESIREHAQREKSSRL
jgi:hypothetical protein